MRVFADRVAAGRALAQELVARTDVSGACVLALPRGGVPVAAEVARALDAPLDVFVVRKIGAPGQPELALGAIASGDVLVMNEDLLRRFAWSSSAIDDVLEHERRELARRERAYRGDRSALALEGRTVILVDDGMATGATMRAAVRAVRTRGAARIIVAVPTAPPDVCASMAQEADLVISVDEPDPFDAVGRWYADFRQTTDDEVRDLLDEARNRN